MVRCLEEKRKKDPDELRQMLDECPAVGELWWHIVTGGVYRVVGRAIHEATLTALVMYERDGVTWARPLGEWRERFRKQPAVGKERP